MKKQNGFTLLEILIVLGIVSVLILLSSPLYFSSLDKQQETQFLETLKFDVLYSQSLSISSSHQATVIEFTESDYTIRDRTNKTLIRRNVPSGSSIDYRTSRQISFNNHGTVRKPGTITLKTKHDKYKIVFPLGKARCYIEKQ